MDETKDKEGIVNKMIDISKKGVTRMKWLLEERHHRDLTRHEIVDLAILGNIWDLREPVGGPIEITSTETRDIVDEILRVRPTYSIISTKQLVQNRLVNMRYEGFLEGTPSTKAPKPLTPEEALREIEQVDKLLDQRGAKWEKQ